MVMSRKDNPKCDLQLYDTRNDDDIKYDAEIQRCIGTAKDTFQKLSKMLKDRMLRIETRKKYHIAT